METAEIIAGKIGCNVEPDKSFIDVDYGEWQGLTVEEVFGKYGSRQLESWKKDPGKFEFPGGDSIQGIRDRLVPALKSAVESHPEGNVGVVSHQLILKLCFLAALDLPNDWFWRTTMDNGSVSTFQYDPYEGFILESWNCVAKLSGAAESLQEKPA